MSFKEIGKRLLFPRAAVMILLIPISAVLLIGSMVFVGTESVIAIISYVISAYTLTVWCFKIPKLIRFFKEFKKTNRYAVLWRENTRLRVKVSLYGLLAWNTLYAVFQLWLGFYHRTFWFCSFGVYYLCLAAMRFFLLKHTAKYTPGESMTAELKKYRACGWILLGMNFALSVILVFMIYLDRTFEHHMITAIAMAAYTFTSFTLAIINVVKYRKYNSPVYSASKAISFVAACVSMLTLESTMLTTFSDESMSPVTQKLLLGMTGGAILLTVILTAIHMIVNGTKKIKAEVQNGK